MQSTMEPQQPEELIHNPHPEAPPAVCAKYPGAGGWGSDFLIT